MIGLQAMDGNNLVTGGIHSGSDDIIARIGHARDRQSQLCHIGDTQKGSSKRCHKTQMHAWSKTLGHLVIYIGCLAATAATLSMIFNFRKSHWQPHATITTQIETK